MLQSHFCLSGAHCTCYLFCFVGLLVYSFVFFLSFLCSQQRWHFAFLTRYAPCAPLSLHCSLLPATHPIIIPHPGHPGARVVRSAAYNVCVFRGYRSLTIASTYQPRAHSHCSLIAYRHAHHHRHHHVPARKDSLSLHWRSLNNVLGFMTYVRRLSHSYLRILTHWLLFHLLSDRSIVC